MYRFILKFMKVLPYGCIKSVLHKVPILTAFNNKFIQRQLIKKLICITLPLLLFSGWGSNKNGNPVTNLF